jgi:hypothetical protein
MLLGRFDHGHCDLLVRLPFHDLMMQDEAVLVFHDADP